MPVGICSCLFSLIIDEHKTQNCVLYQNSVGISRNTMVQLRNKKRLLENKFHCLDAMNSIAVIGFSQTK